MVKYDDIINLERPISKNHMPMPMENRAAQFAPFAALTGYEEAVDDARIMNEKMVEEAIERVLEPED